MLTILLFARLREAAGIDRLQLPDPAAPVALRAICQQLQAHDGRIAEALAATPQLRAAINQRMVGMEALVQAGDEIAFFPPVTGG